MSKIPTKHLSQLLKHDAYHDHTRHYQREAGTDFPDDSTEFLNELGTTDESIGDATAESVIPTIGPTSNVVYELEDTTSAFAETTTWSNGVNNGSSSESSQTILIILGLLLAVLVLVCCILACILAKMRRRGFCTMEGKNQAMCNDDCQGDEMSSRPTPKDSLTSAKLPNCRSSDKLLEQ